MIVVMMSDEDCTDLADVDTGFRETARYSVSGIDDIECAIDDEKI